MALRLIPESVVVERDLWTLAVNRNQDLLGKSMLVLRRECSAVTEISAQEWVALHEELRDLVAALGTLFGPDQVNFAFLMNQDAQVHLHVIPRYASSRTWAGMHFSDPHWGSAFGHEQRPLESSHIAMLSSQLREALSPRP